MFFADRVCSNCGKDMHEGPFASAWFKVRMKRVKTHPGYWYTMTPPSFEWKIHDGDREKYEKNMEGQADG